MSSVWDERGIPDVTYFEDILFPSAPSPESNTNSPSQITPQLSDTTSLSASTGSPPQHTPQLKAKPPTKRKRRTVVPEQSASVNWEEYESPATRFAMLFEGHTPLHDAFALGVRHIDKNIQQSPEGKSWIVYRQNQFKLQCYLSGALRHYSTPMASVESIPPSRSPPQLYVRGENTMELVEGLYFYLYAIKQHENEDKIIEESKVALHQVGPSRTKKETKAPDLLPIVDGEAMFDKLQFQASTSVGGHAYFRVVLRLVSKSTDGLQVIGSMISPRMIVRAQNPGRYTTPKQTVPPPPHPAYAQSFTNMSHMPVLHMSGPPGIPQTISGYPPPLANLHPTLLGFSNPIPELPLHPRLVASLSGQQQTNNSMSSTTSNISGHTVASQVDMTGAPSNMPAGYNVSGYPNTIPNYPHSISMPHPHLSGPSMSGPPSSIPHHINYSGSSSPSTDSPSSSGSELTPKSTPSRPPASSSMSSFGILPHFVYHSPSSGVDTPPDTTNSTDSPWSVTREVVYHHGKVGINTDTPSEALSVHGNIMVTGDILKPSDRRLKRNLMLVDSSAQMTTIENIKIYDYEILSGKNGPRKERGVIAQELEQVIPEAVHHLGDVSLGNKPIDDLLVVNERMLLLENIGATQYLDRVVKREKAELEFVNNKVKELEEEEINNASSVMRAMNNMIGLIMSEDFRESSEDDCLFCGISLLGLGPAWTLFVLGFFFPPTWLLGMLYTCSRTRQKRNAGLANALMVLLLISAALTVTRTSVGTTSVGFLIAIVVCGFVIVSAVTYYRKRRQRLKANVWKRLREMMKEAKETEKKKQQLNKENTKKDRKDAKTAYEGTEQEREHILVDVDIEAPTDSTSERY